MMTLDDAAMTGGEAALRLQIRRGVCHVLFAYDVGMAIDLDETERRIREMTQRATIKHKRRAPRYFEYRPAPVRVTHEAAPVLIGRYQTGPTVDALLYDFGGVSITYHFPIDGPLGELVTLSADLYDNPVLLADSRRRVEELVTAIQAAVRRPLFSDFVETYTIFQIEQLAPAPDVNDLVTTHAAVIAQILRSEGVALSQQEIADATSVHISFSARDVTIIDWDAALVIDPDAEDVLAVLEFANVELLEMRHLDQQLDDALDQAYEAIARRTWRRFALPGSSRADLRRIARLQVDGAILFEGVNNALKLLGDQYLARVYRLASQRFHLGEWDASILRKLETLESIYAKMSDVATGRRMEVLEWIIILLIAASILIPFLSGAPTH